VVFCCENPL